MYFMLNTVYCYLFRHTEHSSLAISYIAIVVAFIALLRTGYGQVLGDGVNIISIDIFPMRFGIGLNHSSALFHVT